MSHSKNPLFHIINETDEIYASPNPMTKEAAEKFIKELVDNYKKQGYYLNSNMEHMAPEEVKFRLDIYTKD